MFVLSTTSVPFSSTLVLLLRTSSMVFLTSRNSMLTKEYNNNFKGEKKQCQCDCAGECFMYFKYSGFHKHKHTHTNAYIYLQTSSTEKD